MVTSRVSRDEDGNFLKEDKERDIKLCAHSDAAIYSYYSHLLSEKYEEELERLQLGNVVTAFRKMQGEQMNNIAFANEVFEFIQANRPCIALGLDVKKFFDRLDHGILMKQLKALLRVDRLPQDYFALYKNLTSFCWVDRDDVYKRLGISKHNPKLKANPRTKICSPRDFRSIVRAEGLIKKNPEIHHKRGIPQGTPISAMLSNVYMLSFDEAMHSRAAEIGGLYRRYCDDIIFITPPEHVDSVQRFAENHVEELKLDLHPDKTHIVEYPENPSIVAIDGKSLQYLGFTFDGNKKLIRASSLCRYYGKMRRGVRLAKLHRRKHNRIELENDLEVSNLRKRKVFIQYSYLIRRRFKNSSGKRHGSANFITYAYDAAERMQAPEIKKQIRGHMRTIRNEIKKTL